MQRVFLCMIIVDVYIWRLKAEVRSVGHVMVTFHCSKHVLLSQYPHAPGGAHAVGGKNYHYNFEQTYAAQARPATAIYMVSLPNEQAFRKMVDSHRNRNNWSVWPGGTSSTHCARAGADALIAGGLKSLDPLDDGGQILPDELDAYLGRISFYQTNAESKRPWQVRMRAGNACAR
jgi:hypothetical protein